MNTPQTFPQIVDTLETLNAETAVIQTPFTMPGMGGIPRTTSSPIRQALVTIEAVENGTAGPTIGESSVANWDQPTPRKAYTDLRLASSGDFSRDYTRLRNAINRTARRR